MTVNEIFPDLTAEEREKIMSHITNEMLKIAARNKEKKKTNLEKSA